MSLPIGLSFAALKGAHEWLELALQKNDPEVLLNARVHLHESIDAFAGSLQQIDENCLTSIIYKNLGESLLKDSKTKLETASSQLSSGVRVALT